MVVSSHRCKEKESSPHRIGGWPAAVRAAKRRSFWGRISLASGRKAQGRVPERVRVIHTTLVSLFQLLMDIPDGMLTNVERESLAACLPSYNELCKPGEGRKLSSIRTRNWTLKKMWYSMADIKCSEKMRGDILLMADKYYVVTTDYEIYLPYDDIAASVLFNMLKQKKVRHDVRWCAIDILAGIYGRAWDTELETYRLITGVWFKMIREHRAPHPHSDRVLESAACLLETYVSPQNDQSRALARYLLIDDRTLPFLFNHIERVAVKCTVGYDYPLRFFSGLLSAILKHSTQVEQRSTMITNYSMELHKTFHHLHVNHIYDFIHHQEFKNIFFQSVSLMGVMWSRVRHECKGTFNGDRRNASNHYGWCPMRRESMMIIGALEDALQDGPRLQIMLGMGMMGIAFHFASDELDRSTTKADVFRAILRVRPEWVRFYKENTKHGIVGNACADLGKQLAYRVRKPVEYVMEEGVDEI